MEKKIVYLLFLAINCASILYNITTHLLQISATVNKPLVKVVDYFLPNILENKYYDLEVTH